MWKVAALLLVAAVGLGLPGRASAICSVHGPDDAYERADVIFNGRVISTDDASKPQPWSATMRVERVWKGEIGQTAQVSVSGPFGQPFQTGVAYLVYGVFQDDSPRVHTDSCMGTAPVADSDAFLDHLDRTVPKRQPWAAVGITLLLVAGVALVVLGRRRMRELGRPARR